MIAVIRYRRKRGHWDKLTFLRLHVLAPPTDRGRTAIR